MKNKSVPFSIGDCVVVKKGVKDPDSGINMGDWQGRVIKIQETNPEETLLVIAWDSITLQNLPASYIKESEEQGLDWAEMCLGLKDVKPAIARDTPRDVERIASEINSNAHWYGLGDEGARIQAVLADVHPRDERGALDAWYEHLEENLSFPFEAEITEPQRGGQLRYGDKVKVLDILDQDDMYGILVAVKRGSATYHFPLCDLTVVGKDSPTKQLVSDYAVWFANR
ncbi:MAG: hypothetical protein HY774_19055 [Acidobacteria bacterium]|nr:hypothetical protein [Acidobacteriota bacterium]